MSLHETAIALQGHLHGPDHNFREICIDSRSDCTQRLFFALRGERFDGHDFLQEAFDAAAAGAVVEHSPPQDLSCIQVADTHAALGRLAASNRRSFAGPLVAVTGSAGKTTCKQMIAALLGVLGNVHATAGNRNNEIGVPLTLLGLGPEHSAAVVEMGAAREGDISFLCSLAHPDIAVITNAQSAHLQSFGNLDAVVRGKGEILHDLPTSGIAVLNADDPAADYWAARCVGRRIVFFGLSARADCRVQELHSTATGVSFVLRAGSHRLPMHLHLAGMHNALNAAAAMAVGLALDIDLQGASVALENMQALPGRLQWVRRELPAVIDDSYNASPGAVRAAIDVLRSCRSPRLLILGEMSELGAMSEDLHREIGEYARMAGLEALFCCGMLTKPAVEAFGSGAEHFVTQRELLSQLRESASDFAVILVKGSRIAHMEDVVRFLTAAEI